MILDIDIGKAGANRTDLSDTPSDDGGQGMSPSVKTIPSTDWSHLLRLFEPTFLEHLQRQAVPSQRKDV